MDYVDSMNHANETGQAEILEAAREQEVHGNCSFVGEDDCVRGNCIVDAEDDGAAEDRTGLAGAPGPTSSLEAGHAQGVHKIHRYSKSPPSRFQRRPKAASVSFGTIENCDVHVGGLICASTGALAEVAVRVRV